MAMIVIVDYGMGNLSSIVNMLKKGGSQALISSDPAAIREAEKLILPGVGAFDAGMKNLHDRKLIDPLTEAVVERKTPVVGLCLGMQLMTKRSDEGSRQGLGWIDGETVRFHVEHTGLKIPHMGWNTIEFLRDHPLADGLQTGARFYFVHSFHVVCTNEVDALGRTTYGYEFVSSVARGNILGVQFHPEKSHRFGMQLLRNFVSMPGTLAAPVTTAETR